MTHLFTRGSSALNSGFCWYAIVIGKATPSSGLSQPGKQPRMSQRCTAGDTMKKEYDLTKLKSRPNPYAKRLKKQVTLRIRPDVIDYFKDMAEEKGIPYQSLINLYLQDCVASHRKLAMKWAAG